MKSLLITSRAPALAHALAHSVRTYASSLSKPYRVQAIPFSSDEELIASLDELSPAELRDLIVFVDLDAESSDPWNVGRTGLFGLAARLVLQYPEVLFSWYAPRGSWPSDASTGNTVARCLKDLLRQLERHEGGARNLFDSTGCRSRLKIRVYDEALADLNLFPPARECVVSRSRRLALAADEEPSFLSLNGYAAYRFGWRAALAPTRVELLRLVGESAKLAGSAMAEESARLSQPEQGDVEGRIHLAILDWDLRYVDDQPWEVIKTEALLNRPLIAKESKKTSILECLRDFGAQILLVSGAEMKNLPKEGARLKRIAKPYGGIFSLPIQERKVRSRPKLKNEPKGARKVGAQGHTATKDRNNGHSAPYGCLSIANHLLSRSRSLAASEPTDVESWVQIALLALEAKELLGGLSKTASLEALALQHEAEVAAEASFIGVSPDLTITERLTDLEEEAGELAMGTGDLQAKQSLETAKFSALSQIVNRLRLRLIAHEKVRNSEECLRQFAFYQRKLEWRELVRVSPTMRGTSFEVRTEETNPILDRLGNCLKCLISFSRFVGRSYVDHVTGAGTKLLWLLLFSAGWVLLFTGIYLAILVSLSHQNCIFAEKMGTSEAPSYLAILGHSTLTFVQLQPGTPEVDEVLRASPYYRFFLFSQLCFAYLHLGLLISVIHRQLTRRAP